MFCLSYCYINMLLSQENVYEKMYPFQKKIPFYFARFTISIMLPLPVEVGRRTSRIYLSGNSAQTWVGVVDFITRTTRAMPKFKTRVESQPCSMFAIMFFINQLTERCFLTLFIVLFLRATTRQRFPMWWMVQQHVRANKVHSSCFIKRCITHGCLLYVVFAECSYLLLS